LAALLPTCPVGLSCHARSSEHVVENEMSLLTGGEQSNVVLGDDLKTRPTECNQEYKITVSRNKSSKQSIK